MSITTTSRRLPVLLVALTGLALVAGCVEGSDPAPVSGVQGVAATGAVAFTAGRDCDTLAEDLSAVAEAQRAIDARFFDEGLAVGGTVDDFAVAESAGDSDAAAAPTAADGALARTGNTGGGSSDTNTQEAGIDEPDVVETDGTSVFLVDGTDLVILDGSSGAVRSITPLGTWGAQLLLQGDRLLVLSGGGMIAFDDVALPEDGGPEGAGTAGSPPVDAAVSTPASGGTEPAIDPAVDPAPITEPDPAVDPVTTPDTVTVGEIPVEPLPEPLPVEPEPFPVGSILALYDVADPAAPVEVQRTELDGWYADARVVDGVARVVVSSYAEVAADLDGAGVAEALPAFRSRTAGDDEIASGAAVSCEQVFVSADPVGLSETSILRVDFEDGFDPADTVTIIADPGAVYASADHLYLAASHYGAMDPATVDAFGLGREIAPVEITTTIQSFDLAAEGPAAVGASGEVAGSLVNSYALSEYEGDLRVATTGIGSDGVSESSVRVLRATGDALTEIGAVGGLGRTETIQSVRYVGTTAYVVTFRQTDPLYVIDLTDPTAPTVEGELKITGFSSYLHPIGDGRVVGVGRDADEEGRDQGFQLSIFDVTDPKAPTRTDQFTVPTGWSAAEHDPHAFLWWAPESVVVIPLETYEIREVAPGDGDAPVADIDLGGVGRSGVAVFRIDGTSIVDEDFVEVEGAYPYRSMVVQDRLWSLFDGRVAIADFDALGEATVVGFR